MAVALLTNEWGKIVRTANVGSRWWRSSFHDKTAEHIGGVHDANPFNTAFAG